MPVPSQEIAACRQGHAGLRATLADLPTEVMRTASRLPGWSVAHVLVHLARNADSIVRRLDAAREGRLVAQYVSGAAGRAGEITRGADEIVQDVVSASEAVDRAFTACPDEVWLAPVVLSTGEQRAAAHLAASRWREVEVHDVDLGLAYGHRDCDDAFVRRFLPEVLQSLPARTGAAALLSWGLGRGEAPQLEPWG